MKAPEWIIKAKEPLFSLHLKQLLLYKYLLYQLVYRDVVASYKQTILGPAWFFIHPLITTLTFTLIFGKLIKVSTDGLPQPLFYLSGIICWNYFSECLNRTASVFKDNFNIFGKVYFPRVIVPISIAISMFFRFLIHLALLSFLIIIYKKDTDHINCFTMITMVPLLVLMMALLGVGLGCIVACLTIKYKDLNFIIVFGLQLSMYTTTVIFPLSAAPPDLRYLVQANPVTAIIESFRYAILSTDSISFPAIVYSLGCSVVLFIIGFVSFNRMEKTFIDTL